MRVRGRAFTARIGASVARVTFVHAPAEELRVAHDVISEFHAGLRPDSPEEHEATAQGYLIARKASQSLLLRRCDGR
jgi:hypothetical protein